MVGKNEEEITKTLFYKYQFLIAQRCMARSLSNLVSNLSKGINI